MNAIKFIQQHGVERARVVVEGAPAICSYFEEYPLGVRYYRSDIGCNRAINLSDLKSLVESVDLIKFYGGIERAKLLLAMGTCLADRPPHEREVQLKQAIADYEQMFGGEHV